MIEPLRIEASCLPSQTWDDQARGTLTWKTLISKETTATNGLVCGIADLQPGDHLALHSHAEPEVYFGISGSGEVLIDAVAHVLADGVVLYNLGGALHGILQFTAPLRWFYTFARDSFDQITYHFPHEGAVSAPSPRQP